MLCFMGPLGHHKNYIQHIVFPNCEDYLNLVEENKSKKIDTKEKYKELRYFINASEALNNILEYMYFDSLGNLDKYSIGDFIKFKNKFYNEYSFLKEIEDFSNAYKHRYRMNKGKYNSKLKNAEEYMHKTISVNIAFNQSEIKVTKVEYTYNNDVNKDLIMQAYKYWFNYINGI